MKKASSITLASLILLLTTAFIGLAANTYFPYQTIEEYYKAHSVETPPNQPAASGRTQPEGQVKPPPREEQPITLPQAPEFLFPKELGFGVAVGVPYDMFYLSGVYYTLRSNTWYRSSSYSGPWTLLRLSQLPPPLRKHKLAMIHKFRNSEFELFWKNKDNYQGRHFRPDKETKEPREEVR